jgi:hypothetical protein
LLLTRNLVQGCDLLASHFQVDGEELLGNLSLALVVRSLVVHLKQRVEWYA